MMLSILYVINRLFCMAKRGPRPIVICGPSGSGKTTMLNRLFLEFPNTFGFSVSHTTRSPRRGEINGVHYNFVNRQEMEKAIANGEFIESANFGGNLYGTSKEAVYKVQRSGKVCILDIEPQGVEQIKKTDLNPTLVFNNPPSISELEIRLRKRNTETEEALEKRLTVACREIEYGLAPGNFHKIIYNFDIDKAYEDFRDYIVAVLKSQEAEGYYIIW